MKKKKKKNKILLLALLALPLLALEFEGTNKTAIAQEIDPDLALASVQAKAQNYDFQKTGRVQKIIRDYPL